MGPLCTKCLSERMLGVEEPDIYDGILWWICTDCGRAMVRETPIDYRRRWAERFVSVHNAAHTDRAALDAAQDEIEKLLSEKEALREQAMPSKERMMSAIHTVLHPACDQPDDCIVDIYTAEDIVFAITGGAS